MHCKYFVVGVNFLLTNFHSTTDDNALRMKVTEAMGVYDDYLKSRNEQEEPKENTNGVGSENEKPKTEGEDKA